MFVACGVCGSDIVSGDKNHIEPCATQLAFFNTIVAFSKCIFAIGFCPDFFFLLSYIFPIELSYIPFMLLKLKKYVTDFGFLDSGKGCLYLGKSVSGVLISAVSYPTLFVCFAIAYYSTLIQQGSANVGKSAFINALLSKLLSSRCLNALFY